VVPARADRGRIIRRRAGTGSLGRQRFVALTKLAGGPVAREAKAALPSAWAYTSGTDRAPSISAAVLAGSVRSADPVLSYGERWIVRRLSPESVRVTIDAMPKRRDEERLAWAMGAELANVHLGDPRAAAAAAADLDGRPERWLRDAARTMAKAVERDWKEWAAAGDWVLAGAEGSEVPLRRAVAAPGVTGWAVGHRIEVKRQQARQQDRPGAPVEEPAQQVGHGKTLLLARRRPTAAAVKKLVESALRAAGAVWGKPAERWTPQL
jgi:hypothetical protein